MAVVLIFALLLGIMTPPVLTVRAEPGSEAITCLTNAPAGDSTVSPRRYTHEEGYDVCIKYQTLSGNQWLWSYGATSSAECAQMIQRSQQFKNVHCCMQPNCNAPDTVLNPNTRIVRPAQLTAVADHNSRRPQLTAKHRRLLSYKGSKQPPLARSNLGSITCYRNVPTKFLQTSQQSAVAPKTYRKTEVSELCARYTYKCGAGDTACSTAEIQTGAWKWTYAPLPSSMCLELKDYSKAAEGLIKNVECCSGSLCNRPNSNLDPTVAVLTSAPTAAAASAAGKHQSTVAAINRGSTQHKLTAVRTISGGRSSMLTSAAKVPRVSVHRPTAVKQHEQT